jgi:hypothetical protein
VLGSCYFPSYVPVISCSFDTASAISLFFSGPWVGSPVFFLLFTGA